MSNEAQGKRFSVINDESGDLCLKVEYTEEVAGVTEATYRVETRRSAKHWKAKKVGNRIVYCGGCRLYLLDMDGNVLDDDFRGGREL